MISKRLVQITGVSDNCEKGEEKDEITFTNIKNETVHINKDTGN